MRLSQFLLPFTVAVHFSKCLLLFLTFCSLLFIHFLTSKEMQVDYRESSVDEMTQMTQIAQSF